MNQQMNPHNPLIRDSGPLGLGSLAGLLELIFEAALALLVLALVGLWYALRIGGRWAFTSPAHARAWGAFAWKHRKAAPGGRGGWWGHWWRNRRLMPDVAPDLGGLVQAPTGAGTLLFLPTPAASGPGRSPERRRRRGR